MPNNAKQLFLLDRLGALTSAGLSFFVVGEFEYFFGMPKAFSQMLALIALLFLLYSLGCRLMVNQRWRAFLWMIAIAHVSYCILTVGFIIYCHHQLTKLNMLYFIGEVAIIMALAYLELSFADKPNS